MPARLSSLILTTATLCWGGTPVVVQAAEVLSLGGGGGYDSDGLFEIVMTGTSMDAVRTALVADGFEFAVGESFNEEVLASYDIVFLGLFDPSISVSAEQRDALVAYVRGGGALIYMGDNDRFGVPNESIAGLFGVSYSTDPRASTATLIPDPAHPIVNGPAGRVSRYDGSGNAPGFFGGISGLGPYAHAVLSTESRTVVAVIEREALGRDSGPVVFIADANGFLDTGLGTAQLNDNITLIRNIFRMAGGDCREDDDCNDLLFCNGHEECVGHMCVAGASPCEWGEGCDEVLESCGPCATHAQCDDWQFCNGSETCDATGTCVAGAEPCPDACEHCDIDFETCQWCSYDLDRNGVIGSGDFAFLSGCVGFCYPPDDPCGVANFDGDSENCVGAGDFAGFSGCFGSTCSECDFCHGPPPGPDGVASQSQTVRVAVQPVSRTAPSPWDVADSLPASATALDVDRSFYVELWASGQDELQNGLTCVYVDLTFDSTALSVQDIASGELFETLHGGSVDSRYGVVRSLGGCTRPGEATVGIDTKWVRVTTVKMTGLRPGPARVRTGVTMSPLGISIHGGFAVLHESQIQFGDLDLTLVAQLESTGESSRVPVGPVVRPPK